VSAPRPGEAAALAAAVAAAGKATVRLGELLTMWAASAPRLIGDPDQLRALLAALRNQEATGAIRMPVTSWDRTTSPALPNYVSVPAAVRRPGPQPWRKFPWAAPLGWASSLTKMTAGQFDALVAINDWLARTAGADVPVVPHRFRSAEIFGHEKVLDDLAKTRLFGPGRVTYELLTCTRFPAPLAAVAVGSGPDVLVVENSDPYWAAVEALRGAPAGPIGAVVWGSGRSFPSQVPSLAVDVAGTGPLRGTAWYWGDLDPTGVAIAVAADQAAPGLIRPAGGLWKALAVLEPSEPGKHTWDQLSGGPGWFGVELWEATEPVRSARGRVAQEAVPPSTVAAWAASR
jgi:hypothetical protein